MSSSRTSFPFKNRTFNVRSPRTQSFSQRISHLAKDCTTVVIRSWQHHIGAATSHHSEFQAFRDLQGVLDLDTSATPAETDVPEDETPVEDPDDGPAIAEDGLPAEPEFDVDPEPIDDGE